MPKQPIPFGSGIAGYLNTGPDLGGQWEIGAINMRVPYVNKVTGSYDYRDVDFGFTRGVEFGGQEFYNWLELKWGQVVLEFAEANLPDTELRVTQDLKPGMNFSQTEDSWVNLHSFNIFLDDSDAPNIDKWWGSNNFGKFGYFNHLIALNAIMPMTWLNNRACTVIGQPGSADGWQIFLEPRVYGTLIAFGKLLPPDIIFTGSYTGSYPSNLP